MGPPFVYGPCSRVEKEISVGQSAQPSPSNARIAPPRSVPPLGELAHAAPAFKAASQSLQLGLPLISGWQGSSVGTSAPGALRNANVGSSCRAGGTWP